MKVFFVEARKARKLRHFSLLFHIQGVDSCTVPAIIECRRENDAACYSELAVSGLIPNFTKPFEAAPTLLSDHARNRWRTSLFVASFNLTSESLSYTLPQDPTVKLRVLCCCLHGVSAWDVCMSLLTPDLQRPLAVPPGRHYYLSSTAGVAPKPPNRKNYPNKKVQACTQSAAGLHVKGLRKDRLVHHENYLSPLQQSLVQQGAPALRQQDCGFSEMLTQDSRGTYLGIPGGRPERNRVTCTVVSVT
jgi:hypothetical protein